MAKLFLRVSVMLRRDAVLCASFWWFHFFVGLGHGFVSLCDRASMKALIAGKPRCSAITGHEPSGWVVVGFIVTSNEMVGQLSEYVERD